ncbi:hypothetical protein [Shewanella surugensis]|uniref:Zinc ribbon domain-containing protein n=1 Tax=Shewanella surugensis TaxID=212020 RepID=A0ABT0LC05_9GAMM|nr:hypothetical protein [Shewanella surugensis]MCL1125238.1 hypothetical protein [Shewanella surugensis]
MNMNSISFWIIFYLIMLALSVIIGYLKGNIIAGFLLGYVLGPIGLILILLSKDRRTIQCHACLEKIHKHSYICPHCQTKVQHKHKKLIN